MLKINEKNLVAFAVQGNIIPPIAYGWEVTHEGKGKFFPSVGGITYNVKVGDSVYGFEADHVEPGISTFAGSFSDRRSANPNLSYNIYSCVGNEATIITGKAKGRKGTVTGHHGGVEHVIIDFPDSTLQKLTYSDKILIHAYGQGLRLVDYPDISITSLDPRLLKKIPIKEKSNKIEVPVVAIVPAKFMGSGLGHSDTFKGDYDIQTSDRNELKKNGLDTLRLGDFVAISDYESTFGWSYKSGAISIAIVVHGDSFLAGHGPGVQTLITSRKGLIEPVISAKANIGYYLKLGRMRKSK